MDITISQSEGQYPNIPGLENDQYPNIPDWANRALI